MTCLLASLVFLAPPADDASPVGRPESMVPGQTARYYIWCDPEYAKWHIRTTTAGRRGVRDFTGTITVRGGAITSATAAKLEERGETEDFWTLKDNGTVLELTLKTDTALDGLDFTVGDDVTELEFDLKIDGEAKGHQVHVGKDAKTYNVARFILRRP